jgi:hypothetical protein
MDRIGQAVEIVYGYVDLLLTRRVYGRISRFMDNAAKILYETPRGYITLEKTGKSTSYVVWLHGAIAAVRISTIGARLTDAFDRAKARLDG